MHIGVFPCSQTARVLNDLRPGSAAVAQLDADAADLKTLTGTTHALVSACLVEEKMQQISTSLVQSA